MTAVVLDPSVTVVEQLDEAWAIPCEVRKPWGCGGDRAAEWIAYLTTCCPVVKTAFYCTQCKDMLLSLDVLACCHCDTQFRPASTAYQRFEPINPGGAS